MSKANGNYKPKPEHKFSFGLWTLGNRGRDPFGDVVRPSCLPTRLSRCSAEIGAWGVNLHDNDLVPIDASACRARPHRARIPESLSSKAGSSCPWRPCNLFYHPVFRDGAFTANDPEVRAYAMQKTMHAMDFGAELGAKDIRVVGWARRGRNRCLPPCR